MKPYRYVKRRIEPEAQGSSDRRQSRPKIAAKGLMVAGTMIIGSVIWPIVSYEVFTAPSLKPQQFVTPIPVKGSEPDQFGSASQELLNPTDWFPNAKPNTARESKITHYTLSIPKFNIIDATVAIGGEDLSKNLVQYKGSALPGELGATIIFGHSILPQFFNPKNYKAIFSLVPTMEIGDEVLIKFDGISYTYRVIDKTEVKPDNLTVLEQSYDNEYLRLITCTPPGTYLRRAVITAALIKV
ncbi:MAG: hypothetical protein A2900_01520 [Candidatus Chisholmbacteria bacterium RIFCSPLOWO2_01_FULL_50_28]|uniref:Sortase n=1 Tax=Candidatus Chisholmbacteria bacterium RIFCSPHIGHO2_01_FULL_52_32 TaxID=1797591 RepID=A0A1G1VU24_9BACT|nr:MAG: hypothetical protein A2786_05220 [Candidatus Chisholmbacteria bacterium RIFCSPHIGHO2_01_FULL_52_32]OGY19769.1 MAG: hypothetical protein A2900_01520 [Candidatus Chisholmbacteria bacterium RIFCSPLOWO2_01_FULL_50_28]